MRPLSHAYRKGKDMAYGKRRSRRSTRSTSGRTAAPRRRKTYAKRRRSTARAQRVTVVLQMQPAAGVPMAGLTLGKKNYRPVRARY